MDGWNDTEMSVKWLCRSALSLTWSLFCADCWLELLRPELWVSSEQTSLEACTTVPSLRPATVSASSLMMKVSPLLTPTPHNNLVPMSSLKSKHWTLKGLSSMNLRHNGVMPATSSHSAHDILSLLQSNYNGPLHPQTADDLVENKENQWMGVTVQSQGPGGKIVVS